MKKIALLLFVLISINLVSFAKQTSNYIKNGSFESGLNLNWEYSVLNRSIADFSLSQDKKIFDYGFYGLKIDVTRLDKANNIYAKTFATVGNDSIYLLQFWAHAPEEAKLYVEVEGAEQKGVSYEMRVGNEDSKGQMVAYHYPFKLAPEYRNKKISITFYFNSSTSIDKSNDPNNCTKTTYQGCTYFLDGLVLVDQSNNMHHDVYNTYLWNYNQVPNKNNQSWTAGDNDVSFDLPDGRRMWFFNDSFYGVNNPGSNVFPGGTFVRNAVVIQNTDGSLNSLPVTNQGGQWTFFRIPDADVIYNTAGNSSSGVKNCFWVGDALIEDGMVKVYLIEVYGKDRSYLGKFTYPELEFVGIEEQEPFCRRYEKFFVEGDKVYLYASAGSGWTRTMLAARCDLGDMNGKKGTWRFWDGKEWSVTDKKYEVSQRGADDVIKLGEGNYVQLSMPVMSPEVYVRFAPAPQGPWAHEKLIAVGDKSANFWYYMPNFHGQLPNGKYSISMSANYHGCLFFCKDCENKLYTDKYWYRQRYVQVDLLALSPYTTNKKDCAGVVDGEAYYDNCGECVEGTTGKYACVSGVAKLYADANFSGKAIGLRAGEYTLDKLTSSGYVSASLSSFELISGYIIDIYADDNFTGEKKSFETGIENLSSEAFDNKAKSIVIRRKGVVINDSIYAIQNNQSKLYLGVEGDSHLNNAFLVQKAYSGDDTQKFRLKHVEDDYYSIVNIGPQKAISVVDNGSKTMTLIKQWDGVEINIASENNEITTQYSDSPSDEKVNNLFDDNVNTRFSSPHASTWILIRTATPTLITKYSLTTASMSSARDPKSWVLYGSNDGVIWDVIDSQSDIRFRKKYEELVFEIENDDSFLYHKIDLTCGSGNLIQFAEMKLLSETGKQEGEFFDSQQFVLQEVKEGVVKIVNKKSDMILEVLDGLEDENIRIYQNEDIGQFGGHWVLKNPEDISSVKYITADNDINVFPNPANDIVTLESKTNDAINRVVAVDITGAVVYDQSNSGLQTSISLSAWANGIYMLKIFTENDVFAQKLIKE